MNFVFHERLQGHPGIKYALRVSDAASSVAYCVPVKRADHRIPINLFFCRAVNHVLSYGTLSRQDPPFFCFLFFVCYPKL